MGKLQKLDNRIQTILKNGIHAKHRTVFVMIGNKGQDQVPIMHQILNSLFNKGKLNVLWCYKKELSFSTHRKKNLKLLNKKRKAGLTSDATIFEQFICSTDIRWCYYHETHRILGQTFDMCVLQDFEALTPNTLARTIETVTGGGLIIFLLKSVDSLRQLCTMAMDVHSRYRTDAHQDLVCRFNERFLLSLASNSRCLLLDDRWRVLPLSTRVLNSIKTVKHSDPRMETVEQQELKKLKVALTEDGSPFSPLVKLCVTFDQARSLVHFCSSVASVCDSISGQGTGLNRPQSKSKNLLDMLVDTPSQTQRDATSAIVLVTASRGRGKSAALGLGLAAAIEAGLPNLYVTAPSPENLTTLMQFALRGLMSFGYEEHLDYAVIRSTDPDYHQAIVRIDLHRQKYRQSLVYLPPWEMANQLSGSGHQVDVVCIDEAAAIPLPLVRMIITGPRLVFMASTVNGYEGTGRSLSLKLIKQLRNECKMSDTALRLHPKPQCLNIESANRTSQSKDGSAPLGKGFRAADTTRVLYEVTLNEAIRYANGDPVEAWLSELLCLDCGSTLLQPDTNNSHAYYPPVDQCQLYYVNRDTLFAYHKSTEVFLHRLMALYVASHYKNSPNDLQLLSDAPAHHIFCLLAPFDPESGKVPEILCVLQVCLEGRINKDRVMRSLSRGLRPSGDLIPWTISQQFCDPQFGELSGARVVRITTHPEYQNFGYGSRALQLLYEYYSGKLNSEMVGSESGSIQASKLCDATQRELHAEAEPENDQQSEQDDVEDEEELIDEIGSDTEPTENLPKSVIANTDSKLLTENFKRRGPSSLPPLLSRLNERPPEQLQYVGVSFGATPPLVRFWKRSGYLPVYLRQTLNELTGEFTCIMLRAVDTAPEAKSCEDQVLKYHQDFMHRFMHLLPGCFRYLDAAYALELIHHNLTRHLLGSELSLEEARSLFSPVDMERLRNYTRSLVDFHVVSDLLPRLARLYFERRLPDVKLNKTQQVILLGMGLQHKTIEWLASEFTRLLGDQQQSGRGADDSKTDPSVGCVINQAEEAKLSLSGTLSVVRGAVDAANKSSVTGGISTGANSWTKRIRGLSFVIIRELVRALDAVLGSNDPDTTPSAELVASSHHGGTVSMILTKGKEDKNDDEEQEYTSDDDDDDDGDEPSAMDVEPALDDAEIERRAELVRQLLIEEETATGGSLNSHKVLGCEADWTRALAGHGSDLSSLSVKLSSVNSAAENLKKKDKKKLLPPGSLQRGHGKGQKKKKLKRLKH